MAVAIHPGTMKANLGEGFGIVYPEVRYANPRKLLNVCLISSRNWRRVSEAMFGTGQGRRSLGETHSHDVITKIQRRTNQLTVDALRQKNQVRRCWKFSPSVIIPIRLPAPLMGSTLVGNIPHCDFPARPLDAGS